MYQQNAHLLLFCAALQIGYLFSSSLHLRWIARKPTWRIWAFGCFAQIIGLLILSHQFYHLAEISRPEGLFFEVGFGFCITGGMNFVFLFSDLRGTPKKTTLIQIFAFLAAGGIAVGSVDGFLDGLMIKDLVLIFLSFWLLRKVLYLRTRKTLVEANLLLVTLMTFFISSLYYLWVFLGYKNSMRDPDLLVATFIESMDVQICLVAFLYMAIGFHWTSVGAQANLKYKLDNEKITALLKEKDLLIQNLLKANVLVESGALSAGLSHELNQYLSVIQVNSELAIHALREGCHSEAVEPYLVNVMKSNQLAATLILSLKRFFLKREELPQRCSIDELISEVVVLYRDRLKKSKIELVLDLAAKEEITLSESLMRQVIGNLLVNAVEALDLISRSDKLIIINSQIKYGQLEFSIFDNGQGIKERVAGDIFSLFQSSKSQGTGLGLWISKHIVEKHHGRISYTNMQGTSSGVEFKVAIPLLANEEISKSKVSDSALGHRK